jgi:hypothetical protein
MARNNPYRPKAFDPAKPLVVRRPFNGNGRHFKPGDPFDWGKLSVSRRRARQLYDAGKVMHPTEVEPERITPTESGPVQVQAPDELDRITDMGELREIARREGAKTTTSKTLQRRYIREHREMEKAAGPDGDAPSSGQPSAE